MAQLLGGAAQLLQSALTTLTAPASTVCPNRVEQNRCALYLPIYYKNQPLARAGRAQVAIKMRAGMKLTKPSRLRSVKPLVPAAVTPKSSPVIGIASWLALMVTLATLVLTLLGYGHDIAYLEAVGLRPEELQRTPLDLLLRSWQPFIHGLTSLNKVGTLEFQQQLWSRLLLDGRWLLLGLPACTAVLAWCVYAKPWRRLPSLSAVWHSGRTAVQTHWQKRWLPVPTRRWGYAGWLIWPMYFGVTALLLATLWLTAALGVVFVVIVPLMGISSGQSRAQQEVLAPVGCVGQQLKAGQDPAHQARCVRVLRDSDELARGYLIDYGAGRLFLYQPCVKRPLSLSLERTVIEQIDTLEFAAPGKGCHASLLAYKKPH